MSTAYQVFVAPLLANLGSPPRDPTWGRYLAPKTPTEIEIQNTPDVRIRTRRVFTSRSGPSTAQFTVGDGEDISLTKEELVKGKGKEWQVYQVWESDAGKEGKAKGCDLVLLHGMCDYGAKWTPHATRFLAEGYRVIVPDLASHGRSTGVHVHIHSASELADGVHAVLTDVKRWSPTPSRKTFLSGSSLGGWTSLWYPVRYPDAPIDGLFLIAPLVGVAPDTMPHPITTAVARLLRSFAGRLPLAPAVKGNVSDDPRVEAEFYADAGCYHGDLRIATGLALLEGLQALMPIAPSFTTPLRIVHGSHDRATDHRRSVEFAEKVASKDKSYEVYEGYEHVMLKVGVDQKDDEKRERVLADMAKWLGERI